MMRGLMNAIVAGSALCTVQASLLMLFDGVQGHGNLLWETEWGMQP
jgi:hypothetical protein